MNKSRIIIVLFLAGLGLFWVNRSASAAGGCYILSNDVGYVCDANPPASSFVQPPLRPDSILPGRKYGRLADNINIYSEPSMSSPIVRNAGDGYL